MGEQNVDAGFESSQGEDEQTDEISMLMDRISDLEDTVSKVTEQQTELTHKVSKQSERLEKMDSKVDSIRNEMDEIEEQSEVRESRINNINRSLDALEGDLQGMKGDIVDRADKLKRRMKGIENMMDINEKDIAKAAKPDACELEQLTVIPDESRKDQFTVRVQRAIALYENFHEISTPVKSGGERVLSKDIKTFLNGYSNSDIKYTQVQRVIDSFNEKTGDDYQIRDTSDGRAIVWTPDDA